MLGLQMLLSNGKIPALGFLEGEVTKVTTETIMNILNAITGVFSIEAIVAFIAGLLGVSITFVFLWWGVRKGTKVLYRAVAKGKFSI